MTCSSLSLFLKTILFGFETVITCIFIIFTHLSSCLPDKPSLPSTFKFASWFKASLSRVCIVCRFLHRQLSSGSWLTYKRPCSLINWLSCPAAIILHSFSSMKRISCPLFPLCWDISGLSFRMYSACCQQWVHCSWPIKSQKHCVVVIHFLQFLQSFHPLSWTFEKVVWYRYPI